MHGASFRMRIGNPMATRQNRGVPVFYQCQRCTACCRWPGQVRLDDATISRMAEHLQLPEHDFIQRYTRLAKDRRGLALADKENGECIFLEGLNCAVQAVKPQQCRDFPNLWNFPGFEKVCRAIPQQVSAADYAELVGKATRRGIDRDPVQ